MSVSALGGGEDLLAGYKAGQGQPWLQQSLLQNPAMAETKESLECSTEIFLSAFEVYS